MNISNLKIIPVLCVTLGLVACADPLPPAPIVDGWQQQSSASVYRVQPDDTIYSIAWMFGMDYRDIARYNHLSEPYAVREGQALNLTSSSSTHSGKAVTYPVATTYPVTETQPVETFTETTSAQSSSRTLYTPSESSASSVTASASQSSSSAQPSVKDKPASAATATSTKPAGRGTWLWPVKGEVVKNFSTTSGGNRGIDIAGKLREPVGAAASGKVVYTGSSMPGYGQLVIVKHDNNNLSAYAFNDSILVKEGEAVKAGQQIATVGKNSEGKPMLHFEVRSNGKPQDPLRYLK